MRGELGTGSFWGGSRIEDDASDANSGGRSGVRYIGSPEGDDQVDRGDFERNEQGFVKAVWKAQTVSACSFVEKELAPTKSSSRS